MSFLNRKSSHFLTAVILCAGSSTRMGNDKLFLSLGNRSVLYRTITAFENASFVNEIIIVTRPDKLEQVAEICNNNFSKVTKVINGGSTRLESSYLGVSAADKKADFIAIHDGARPIIDSDLINRIFEAAVRSRAAIPVIECSDSIKYVDESGYVKESADRSMLKLVQTPQIFSSDIIKGALSAAYSRNLSLTDDCAAVERLGFKVATVEGDKNNIKITEPVDITIAEEILRKKGLLY